jgi:hypothetical protein
LDLSSPTFHQLGQTSVSADLHYERILYQLHRGILFCH